MEINSGKGVAIYQTPNSISISNSTVCINTSNRAFYLVPTVGDYENGYRVMAGDSEEDAEVVDISKTTKYYQKKYVKIEPMPGYTLNLTAPDKTVYSTGEQLDITGAKLELSYEDNVTQDITLTKNMITGFDSTKEGTQTLTVTYGSEQTQFDVTVIDLSNTYTTNLNANGITNEDFTITAKEGYFISDTKDGTFGNTLSVSKGSDTYYFYVKHTDSGTVFGPISVAYEIDKTAPTIGNIEDRATYYTTQKVTVEDKNLDTVTVNGNPIEGDIILTGNTDATYTITAKDKAGNETTVTVTMKPIAALTEGIKDITEENVTSGNKDTIEQVRQTLSKLETNDETERKEINQSIENCEKLIKKIETLNHETSTQTPATTATDKPVATTATDKPVQPVVATNQVVLPKVKASKTSNKLTWNKMKDADGYYVYAAKCNTKKKKYSLKKVKEIKSAKTVTYTHKKLKKNTWYKYQIVAYKKVNGKKVVIGKSLTLHSLTSGSKTYSNPSKVTVSKTTLSLKKGKTAKIKAKMVLPKKKKTKNHAAKVRYVVSDKTICSVSASGKVKAKKKGTCTVYAVAQNGVNKKIKVTVK